MQRMDGVIAFGTVLALGNIFIWCTTPVGWMVLVSALIYGMLVAAIIAEDWELRNSPKRRKHA